MSGNRAVFWGVVHENGPERVITAAAIRPTILYRPPGASAPAPARMTSLRVAPDLPPYIQQAEKQSANEYFAALNRMG
jgi:hypothetical protein